MCKIGSISAITVYLCSKYLSIMNEYQQRQLEMAQPEGLTIQVTTYTDGSTNAVKVVK